MIIIDRFEEDFAVLEHDGEMIEVEKKLIEKNAKEGDFLILKDGKYYIEDNKERKNEIDELMKKLWKD